MLKWTREDILEALKGKTSKTIARRAFLQHKDDDVLIKYRQHRLIVWAEEYGYNTVTIDCHGDRDQPIRRILNKFVFSPARESARNEDGHYELVPVHNNHFYKCEGVWYVEIAGRTYVYEDRMQIIDAPVPVVVGVSEVMPETLTMFRWSLGEVTAVFPECPADKLGEYCKCLMEDGDAPGIHLPSFMEDSREALPGEYAALEAILKEANLNIRIIKRVQQSHHRERRAAAGVTA